MKFLTFNVDLNSLSFDPLGSRSPWYGDVKYGYLLQNALILLHVRHDSHGDSANAVVRLVSISSNFWLNIVGSINTRLKQDYDDSTVKPATIKCIGLCTGCSPWAICKQQSYSTPIRVST